MRISTLLLLAACVVAAAAVGEDLSVCSQAAFAARAKTTPGEDNSSNVNTDTSIQVVSKIKACR